MRQSLLAFALCGVVSLACESKDRPPTDPEPVVGVVRQELSNVSYPTRDDMEDGNDRWGGTASTAYVGWSGLCNSQTASRRRYMNVRFDLSNIPNCATVTNVTVQFTQLGCKTCGSTDTTFENPDTTCPPRRSFSAGALPLYGTCRSFTFAALASAAIARCPDVPAPEVA